MGSERDGAHRSRGGSAGLPALPGGRESGAGALRWPPRGADRARSGSCRGRPPAAAPGISRGLRGGVRREPE